MTPFTLNCGTFTLSLYCWCEWVGCWISTELSSDVARDSCRMMVRSSSSEKRDQKVKESLIDWFSAKHTTYKEINSNLMFSKLFKNQKLSKQFWIKTKMKVICFFTKIKNHQNYIIWISLNLIFHKILLLLEKYEEEKRERKNPVRNRDFGGFCGKRKLLSLTQ